MPMTHQTKMKKENHQAVMTTPRTINAPQMKIENKEHIRRI